MDESLTAASNRALEQRVRAFARHRALAAHFARFPHDRPTLAAVVRRRVHGTDHPATRWPEAVDGAAAWLEERQPDWVVASDVDQVVDTVLTHVEMLVAGIGRRSALAP